MIIRLVKLTFQTARVPDFLALFNSSEKKIKEFPGCIMLALYRDINNADVFFTYSIWNSEEELEFYRNSVFFQGVWNQTKTYFSASAVAWSLSEDI